MTTDIEIARAAKPQNINKIAEKLTKTAKEQKTHNSSKRVVKLA